MSNFMIDTLRELEKISTSKSGCTRIAYTDSEQDAHDLVWEEMSSLEGLERHVDAAGNMFIVPAAATAQGAPGIVLAGSHVDTVIEGGWLDGTLGVVAAMNAVRSLAENGRAHPSAGVVVFRDEEGVRFNTGLFGSRVFAGICTDDNLDVKDGDGVAVREVVPDPAGCISYQPPVTPAVFLECHIEQGLRLIDSRVPIGVVSGIVGIRRFVLVGRGMANHAGTTDMIRRRDALVPVARIVSDLPSLVERLPDTVITCGRLTVQPGAPNIVPGFASAIVELRGHDVETLERVSEQLRDVILQVQARHPGITLELEGVVDVEPMPTDDVLRYQLVAALEEMDIDCSAMPSMAGHDTQHAMHRCASGMFFIPSINGISHNPEEDSAQEDINRAGDVMTAWMRRCIKALPA
jgi:allantoate deiminase